MARSESQKRADKAYASKKVRLEVVFNPDNVEDAKRIAKLAAMPEYIKSENIGV